MEIKLLVSLLAKIALHSITPCHKLSDAHLLRFEINVILSISGHAMNSIFLAQVN